MNTLIPGVVITEELHPLRNYPERLSEKRRNASRDGVEESVRVTLIVR